jgi:hypothetical protein
MVSAEKGSSLGVRIDLKLASFHLVIISKGHSKLIELTGPKLFLHDAEYKVTETLCAHYDARDIKSLYLVSELSSKA